MMRVADFHCDLLWYLSNDSKRTVMDSESQASVPLLKQGGVVIQTFPIYTVTGVSSALKGAKQFEIFEKLSHLDPDFFGPRLRYKVAIENASGFCTEDESLEVGFKRLELWRKKFPIQYISLTWNEENRFGGGAETTMGSRKMERHFFTG
jgi:membrane dipeptidase